MVRQIDAATLAAIENSTSLVIRDFVWFQAKDRSTGDPVEIGLWTDVDTVTANVIDPNTGLAVARNYTGDGSIVSLGIIPEVIDLTIQSVSISLSNIHPIVNTLIRTNNARHAPVQIHRGFLDPVSHALVSEPLPQFVGMVNEIEVNTAEAGGEGEVSMTLVSQVRELTRTFGGRRSDTTQKLRNSGDDFRVYTGVAGQWEREIRWGEESPATNG